MHKENRSNNFTISAAILFLTMLYMGLADNVSAAEISRFNALYEPSGVVQMKTGEVIVIEDEGKNPFYLALPQKNSLDVLLKSKKAFSAGLPVDDLEGITASGNSTLYAITSFSVTKKGKRKEKREQLLTLKISKGAITLKANAGSLQPFILKRLLQLPGIDKELANQINIEGLALDKTGQKLLLGFRSPTLNGKAIILELLHITSLFENNKPPAFSNETILLDLDGSGIRAMEYFPHLNSYLLAGEVKNKRGKLRSKIWAWDGSSETPPAKVTLPKIKGIKNIEGLTPLMYESKHFLLFVCDDGSREKKKGAHYVLLNNSLISPTQRME